MDTYLHYSYTNRKPFNLSAEYLMPDCQNHMEAFLQSRLQTKFVGQSLHYFTRLTSTMEIAREMAADKVSEGTVIIAEEQTSGRGRLDRAWLSPKGSLAMSVVLHPGLDTLPQLIMVASLAVVQAIEKVTGLKSAIKWPNDILLNDRKVCGILIESEFNGNRLNFCILGIGININFDPLSFPDIATIATSLSHELDREISKTDFTCALLIELEHLYLKTQTGSSLYQEWQQRLDTLGKSIRVNTGNSIEQGKAESVAENGNLLLRRADGSLVEIIAGDVTIIKD